MSVRVSAIIFRNNKLVIVEHDKGDGPYYLLPGGGWEHGESLHEGVIREVREECGLRVEVDKLVFMKTLFADSEQGLDLVFSCKNISGDLGICDPDGKVTRILEVTHEELQELRFYPRQLKPLVFSELPVAEYLGNFKYPE
jgi:8-oxo-dGTP diphosphatase